MRAGSKSFSCQPGKHGISFSSFHGERTGRTCLYTVSAGLTGAVCPDDLHRFRSQTGNHVPESAIAPLPTIWLQCVDTSVAQDTEAWIIGEKFVGVISISPPLLLLLYASRRFLHHTHKHSPGVYSHRCPGRRNSEYCGRTEADPVSVFLTRLLFLTW